MFEKFLLQFAEQTKLNIAIVKKVVEAINQKSKEMGNTLINDSDVLRILESIQWQLKSKVNLVSLLNSATDEDITLAINELILSRIRNQDTKVMYSEDRSSELWLYTEMSFKEKVLKEGDKVKLQIMKEGKWKHQLYGNISFSEEDLQDIKRNFDENARGIEIAVDENHDPAHKALGWYRELFFEGKKILYATIELTKKGAELLNEGAYKYFSPEIFRNVKDEESGMKFKNLLAGGAFTNRPFFKGMQPLMFNEVTSTDQKDNTTQILFFNDGKMKDFLALLAKLGIQKNISESDKQTLVTAFNELSSEEKTPELTAAFNEVVADDKSGDDKSKDEPEDTKEDDKEDEEEGDDKEDEGKVDKVEQIQATEVDGKVTILASEFSFLKEKASTAQALENEKKTNSLTKRIKSLCFSESNKMGVLLPKKKTEVLAFTQTLDDKQVEQFFSILSSLQTLSFSELGKKDTTTTVTTEQYSEEEVQFLMKSMNFTEEQAKEALGKEKTGK